jgi:ribosomal-protein-alanine N-acetyltransferase
MLTMTVRFSTGRTPMIAGCPVTRAEHVMHDEIGTNAASSPSDPPRANRLGPIRRLAPGDLEACLALDRSGLEGWWSRRQWEEELAHPDAVGIGGWMERDLVAMAWGRLVVDELQITLVVVDPERRRLGWGQRVLEGLCRSAAEAGMSDASLEVAAANQAALALYRRLGFRTVGVRKHYYRNGEDALFQRRRGLCDSSTRSGG